MSKKDGDTVIAVAAGIAASKEIESGRRADEVQILGDAIPEGERASKIFRIRFSRAKRPGQQPGGQVWANAGDYPYVQGDPDWFEKLKVELVAKYGPGDYDGTPCDANKKVIEKAPHWIAKVSYDEALQMGWIDPVTGTTGQPAAAAQTKDRVAEAKERVAVAQEELQLESLKKQLTELKAESGPKRSETDPAHASKIEDLTRKLADSEKQTELAKQAATHREELAKRDRDKSDLENKLAQQQRDLDAIKLQISNPTTKPAVITPEQVGHAVTQAIDSTVGKMLDKATGWATLLTPLVGALATKLTTAPPAPPAPPPQPDYIAIITALKNTIQPPSTVDPYEAINKITTSMVSLRKAAMPDEDEVDEEEVLDRELRKFERLKTLTGGGKSTVAEIGDIANRTLKTIGETVVGVAGARAGGPSEPQSEEDQRLAKKRRALARAKALAGQQGSGVVKDPPVKPTKVQQEAEPDPKSGEPTAKDWASLAQGLTKALKAKANPASVARALVKKFPQVAAELIVAPNVALVEVGLASVAGKMGRPYGVFVNELASELRKDEGAAWGARLLAELKKVMSGQGQSTTQEAEQEVTQEASKPTTSAPGQES